MAGHDLKISIQSGGQVEQITLSEDAVEKLIGGTPAETVNQVRDLTIEQMRNIARAKAVDILQDWITTNVTVQS